MKSSTTRLSRRKSKVSYLTRSIKESWLG